MTLEKSSCLEKLYCEAESAEAKYNTVFQTIMKSKEKNRAKPNHSKGKNKRPHEGENQGGCVSAPNWGGKARFIPHSLAGQQTSHFCQLEARQEESAQEETLDLYNHKLDQMSNMSAPSNDPVLHISKSQSKSNKNASLLTNPFTFWWYTGKALFDTREDKTLISNSFVAQHKLKIQPSLIRNVRLADGNLLST